VLLLILVGVAIKVSVDSRLFGRAKDAVNKTNHKVGELQGEVDRLLGEWDKIENGSSGGTSGGNSTGNNTGDNPTNPGTATEPEVTVTRGTIASDQQSVPLIITATENANGIEKIEIYKKGNDTPVETFTCNNEKTVTKTYTARDNTTYTIKVYSKLTATKAIAIADLVFPIPEVDTYVAYQPKTAGDYVIEAKYSGYTSDQYIPQTPTLRWKVLKTYEDGRIELIAETPTTTKVYFQGALGVNNGVYILNDLCKTQYSNPDYGAVARSIDLEDIENRMTAAGITAKNNAINGYTKTFSGSYSYSPDIYDHVDKTTAGESVDYYEEPTTATYSQKGSLFVKHTDYYNVKQIASYYDSTEFYNLIFGLSTSNAYWLASRYAYCSSYYASFGLRYVYGTIVGGSSSGSYSSYLFLSSNDTNRNGFLVRPIVTLGSDFRLQQVDGSSEWQIVRK